MPPISRQQTGFTLIELLTVMLILVAMASVTIETTSELAFQNRYEVTKDRYEKIKRAIIGRPDVLINGQPDISGFVADMGRLPINIHDLLEENYCLTDRTETDSVTCGANWRTQPGWAGPYLSITKSPDQANAFPDGWGNLPTAYCTDLNFVAQVACTGAGETWVTEPENHNYGWYFFVDTTGAIDELHIFSLGKDRALGGAAPDYDADYPSSLNHPNEAPALNANDWTVDINNIKANILTNFSPPTATPFACDLSSISDGYICNNAGWTWPGSYKCSVDPAINTDKALCETALGLWAWQPVIKNCSDGVNIDKVSCEAAGETWGECVSSETDTTAETSKNYCENNSGTWTFGSPTALCIKITRNGDDYITQPALPTIEENGNQRLIEFDNTYDDKDGDSVLDLGENLMPMGAVLITINSPTCASPAYRDVSAINTTLYPKTTLPIINW